MAKDIKTIPIKSPHNVIMENRENLRISGVSDIGSFTDNRIVLSTVMGELVIRGDGLHINALDADCGEFSMTGKISSLNYSRHSVLDGPIKKLFR